MSFTGIIESHNNLLRHPGDLIHIENSLNFSPGQLTHPVIRWILDRPPMAQENKQILYMAVRLFDEINELEEEAQRQGTAFDRKALEKEALDTLFFVISLATNLKAGYLEDLQSDLPTLAYSYNGAGSHSNIYDIMREIAANLADSNNVGKDLKEFLRYWFSYMRHAPIEDSPEKILLDVVRKNGSWNRGNYPSVYFSGKHPVTHEMLNPDQLRQQFFHSKSMLRMLREAYGNSPAGLTLEQHQPHALLILDFEHADENQITLKRLLAFSQQTEAKIETYLESVKRNPHTSWQGLKEQRQSH